jgi:GNAT superfamily N-acetyltransferase
MLGKRGERQQRIQDQLDGGMNSNYRFSADTAEVDRDQVHRWIGEQSYWAPGRSRSTQDAAIDGSRNFGIYDIASNRQAAYARMIIDGVTFAWLCDVFVDPEVRGHGIGALLIAGVVQECNVKRNYRARSTGFARAIGGPDQPAYGCLQGNLI